jgi:dihydrofolate reductase
MARTKGPRKLMYQVATSLDGYIAGTKGEYDWIPDTGDDFDMEAHFARFDALVMGRGTWELVAGMGGAGMFGSTPTYVVSTTLDPAQAQGVQVIARDVERRIAALKAEPGKTIWLYGGGKLFASLLDAGLVDQVELAVMPVLLGSGIPLLAPTRGRHTLKLAETRVSAKTGIALMTYDVVAAAARPARKKPKR